MSRLVVLGLCLLLSVAFVLGANPPTIFSFSPSTITDFSDTTVTVLGDSLGDTAGPATSCIVNGMSFVATATADKAICLISKQPPANYTLTVSFNGQTSNGVRIESLPGMPVAEKTVINTGGFDCTLDAPCSVCHPYNYSILLYDSEGYQTPTVWKQGWFGMGYTENMEVHSLSPDGQFRYIFTSPGAVNWTVTVGGVDLPQRTLYMDFYKLKITGANYNYMNLGSSVPMNVWGENFVYCGFGGQMATNLVINDKLVAMCSVSSHTNISCTNIYGQTLAAGHYKLQMYYGGEMMTVFEDFPVLADPTLHSVTPTTGSIEGGLRATIFGSGFGEFPVGSFHVVIGGTRAPVISFTDTQVVFNTPKVDPSYTGVLAPVFIEFTNNYNVVQSLYFTYNSNPVECPLGCGHGVCVAPNVCVCEGGWSGAVCAVPWLIITVVISAVVGLALTILTIVFIIRRLRRGTMESQPLVGF